MPEHAELAHRPHLAETTVKTHVGRVLAKLQLRDRVQALVLVLVYQTGLVSPASHRITPVGADDWMTRAGESP